MTRSRLFPYYSERLGISAAFNCHCVCVASICWQENDYKSVTETDECPQCMPEKTCLLEAYFTLSFDYRTTI